jgi:gamma-glutamyltranspeptidase/glutathione hydrolase
MPPSRPGFALAVTYPIAGNIGGGGFMVIRMADGRSAAIDYREVAPLAASRDMYLDAQGNLTSKSVIGHLAVGVPGAVAGMNEALKKYGTMSCATSSRPRSSSPKKALSSTRACRADSRAIKKTSQVLRWEQVLPERPSDRARFALRAVRARVDAQAKSPTVDQTASIKVRSPTRSWPEMKRGGGIITLADLARYKPSGANRSSARIAGTRSSRCRRRRRAGSR